MYIYKFRINNEGNFVSTLCEEIPETVAPHIYEADYFASTSDYSDILVYATSEQVFAFRLINLQQILFITRSASRYLKIRIQKLLV